jgi:hypothetical protein
VNCGCPTLHFPLVLAGDGGIPSIAPIEGVDMDSLSDTFDVTADRASQMFDELKQLSEDAQMSEEDEDSSLPDLDRSSTRNEGDFEEPTLSVSLDSLASLIPADKKKSMNQFEETLKEMIQEARDLARTPVRQMEAEDDEHQDIMSRYNSEAAAGTSPRDRDGISHSI